MLVHSQRVVLGTARQSLGLVSRIQRRTAFRARSASSMAGEEAGGGAKHVVLAADEARAKALDM